MTGWLRRTDVEGGGPGLLDLDDVAAGRTAQALRLLLVEDDPLDAELLLDTIARHGVVIRELAVVDTRMAFERHLREFRPGLIVADYALPGFSGQDALRSVAEVCPDVPFIIVSGMLGEDLAVELLKAGAWDYVLKDRLTRLGPAIDRALADSAAAAARLRLRAEREAALERARLSEDRLRDAVRRLGGLQGLTAALATTLTEDDVAEVLANVMPGLIGADLCLTALLDPTGRMLTLGKGPAGPGGTGPEWSCCPAEHPSHPVARALNEGRAVYRDDPDVADRAGDLGWPFPPSASWAVLPLGGKRRLGVLILRWPRRRALTPAERSFLATVAAQSAQALERARLYESKVQVAHALQHALLPPALPEIPGLRCAARYLTAQGDAVGGDWYDVFPLPGGATGLVMGDVEGHSADAAAVMGQARNVLRAYAADGHGPAEVMGRLNRFLHAHADLLVTCCYAELDPGTTVVTTVCAGHQPAAVLDPTGRVHQLATPAGLPLGADAGTQYTEHTQVLPAGARLVMFTDGLADGGRAVHPRIDAFLELLGRHVDDGPEALADALVARAEPAPPLADDAALLVVQLLGLDGRDPGRVASRSFQATPAATPTARHFLLDVLGAWHLDDLKDLAALTVSELVTNAVLHTAGEVRLQVRWLGGDQLWIGVTDESDRVPTLHEAADEDISGRGLAIVDQVAGSWGVDHDPAGGKTVWLTLLRDPVDG